MNRCQHKKVGATGEEQCRLPAGHAQAHVYMGDLVDLTNGFHIMSESRAAFLAGKRAAFEEMADIAKGQARDVPA